MKQRLFAIVAILVGVLVAAIVITSTPTTPERSQAVHAEPGIEVSSPDVPDAQASATLFSLDQPVAEGPSAHGGVETTYAGFQSYLLRDTSLYPEDPGAVYLRNITKARSGEGEAMYWVSVALHECSQTTRSRTELQDDIVAGKKINSLWNEYMDLMERCRSLSEVRPGEDLPLEAEQWLQRSADAGFETAKTMIALDERRFNDAAAAIDEAAAEDGYPAWYLASRYLREFEQLVVGDNPEVRQHSEAWHLAACSRHPACDARARGDIIRWRYTPLEADAVMGMANQIIDGDYPLMTRVIQ